MIIGIISISSLVAITAASSNVKIKLENRATSTTLPPGGGRPARGGGRPARLGRHGGHQGAPGGLPPAVPRTASPQTSCDRCNCDHNIPGNLEHVG